jgi:glycogen synthase
MANAMAADFSWERPAREYERLYHLALERRRHPTP